ncbi:MAG TPA: tetratricopeptide repeat protein [Terriglobales bacterium]|nr:tetratricopeptide repeat protein [Terriglobales bacterium]
MSTSTEKPRTALGSPQNPSIPEALLERLKDDLANRRIASGIACLQEHAYLFASLGPDLENAGRLTGYAAQWVDLGFDSPALIEDLLSKFPRSRQAQLPLREYSHLRMAQGMLAMAEEEPDAAIQHLNFVLTLAEDLQDQEMLAIANFWKGRCLRKKAEYGEALTHTLKGQSLALALGHPKMAAVMSVLESWLLFQKGRSTEARRILQQAETALQDTDDYVTLGNIHSSYGRIARREGRFDQAIEHFARAIAEYRRRDSQHRNLARSLANIALVKRNIALALREKIDAEAERRRGAATRGPKKGNARILQMRERLAQLRQEAFAHLDEAAHIYPHYPNHHGLGSVHLNYGYLHLDNGDFDRADVEASTAFEIAEQKTDYILMARAQLLRCMIANAKLEEEVAEGADSGSHARNALNYVKEAIELARRTQHRRLLASAFLWQGLSQSNAFFDDFEAARQSYEQATAILKREEPGSLWTDLQALKARLFRTGTVSPTLRAWTQGLVGTKTFQQLTEEFEDLIIPKVWEREGRKVSRVATRLSISPKKVRRILGRAVRRKDLG